MYEMLKGHGIVPVIKFDSADDALPLADALAAGGIKIMEITYRSEAASSAIEQVAKERPDILVGAGTVLNLEQLKAAEAAGAKFIVSPGFDETIVVEGLKRNLVMLPGCVTPSEIMAAMSLGLKVLKFFPASVYGGIKAIKSLASVFGGIKFMPTGGVTADNLAEYLSIPQIQACGGTWMVKANLINGAEFETITKLSQEATDIYRKIRPDET
ncbi:MAG: bifunctional 4-hydroxy-2-oxoglutarate aldolase/2-dehydro-3-deoxy-phosphogluconate aldolase [Fastidiosipilaceae bacterium]|jgi:2-dehydro-3-deoxyphosphogluconate aldolase/(4S)-4-hydroxy-2-oxoglutarate aldolase|nr:bifunctional 4-hydroxy-2-oxoglutarate aldolase/2-dehydro-3-deoxy-phosphogluconate aldolase [Clostridiaceae bacterium]